MADYLGSYNVGGIVRFYCTTHDTDGAAIAPSSAFEAADIRVYKDGSATQRASEAGYTMTSPFDSVTGLHGISIDLSDNTDAGFYAAGSEYAVVLVPDETVDTFAVVRVLAYFSIERVVKVNTTQAAGVAWGSGAITSAVIADGAITAAKIADGAIGRATFAADTGLQTIRSNTAQAGAAGTITLDASASAVPSFYVGDLIYTTGGLGVGQVRLCTAYNESSKVASIVPNWATTPDATTTFAVLPAGANAFTAAALAQIVAAGDIDGYSIESALKLILAANAGKSSGMAAMAPVFRAADDSKARITATTDANNNRTAVTLDATG